jgi:hypothetical protein
MKKAVGIRLNNKNFNRDGGLMLSRPWHPVINMLSNQEAGLTQQALDTNQHLPLASAPLWTWNSGYLTWTDSADTSVPRRRGQRWSSKRWFFRLLTNWQLVAREFFIIQSRCESYKSYILHELAHQTPTSSCRGSSWIFCTPVLIALRFHFSTYGKPGLLKRRH